MLNSIFGSYDHYFSKGTHMTNRLACLSLLLVATHWATAAAIQESSPEEVGNVSWKRDWDETFQQAKTTGKPRLVLFQEVPG